MGPRGGMEVRVWGIKWVAIVQSLVGCVLIRRFLFSFGFYLDATLPSGVGGYQTFEHLTSLLFFCFVLCKLTLITLVPVTFSAG